MTQKKSSVCIVGAGISGLSIAYNLRHSCEVRVFEKSANPGGVIHSSIINGCVIEKGPHIFQSGRSEALLKLIAELGLEEDLVFSQGPKVRYVLHNGKLEAMPNSLISFLSSKLTRGGVCSFLAEPFRKRNLEDETLDAFAKRRFGKAIAENLIAPLCIGIWGGSSKSLSVKACLPRLKAWESEYGSILKGAFMKRKKGGDKGLFTLKRGMQSLIEGLSKECPNLHLEEEVLQVRPNSLLTTKGEYPFDRLILATPLFKAAEFLAKLGLKSAEFEVPYKGLQVVNLLFEKDIPRLHGFGFLAKTPDTDVLGAIFDSDIFGGQLLGGPSYFTVMLRESCLNPEEVALKALHIHLGDLGKPKYSCVSVYKKAVPQFELGYLGHLEALKRELQEKFPQISLAGNYLNGVSVNDCVSSSLLSQI